LSVIPPEPDPNTIQIPLVALQGVQMRIDQFPTGERMLVLGPLALGVHLTEPVEKWLAENLAAKPSGIIVPTRQIGDIKL
jgi:hypothetical protein